jgi:hypothetical protein
MFFHFTFIITFNYLQLSFLQGYYSTFEMPVVQLNVATACIPVWFLYQWWVYLWHLLTDALLLV